MATGKVKMLFSDAPRDAYEKLLSPQLKQRMEQENEAIRLKQVRNELSVVQKRRDKNIALAAAFEEIRDRLRRLEEETIACRDTLAKVTNAAQNSKDNEFAETLKVHEVASSPTWLTSSLDGAQGRRVKYDQEVLQQDVAKYISEQKESKI
ncbi:uncharacterized protein PHALS_13979 [Plasmopara halstedii]|uniref:Uncharacterized protein n=1 Tax=Plasmopara halstedii TaxID=4781 RepID=A0A0P1AR78_PLAHL|nr:uncharacterized protein PHALS_13979 [Plasmopara halstedii]CEG43684.1 hypothetical protein PHALS_13979 [Plasmopara halstedii]|eukprot:XP_024580053.1 hypothetical protein PHALS_13979 [Plasmopara halstedii]